MLLSCTVEVVASIAYTAKFGTISLVEVLCGVEETLMMSLFKITEALVTKRSDTVAEFCIKHRTQNRSLDSLPTQKSDSYDYNFPVSPLHSKEFENYEEIGRRGRERG